MCICRMWDVVPGTNPAEGPSDTAISDTQTREWASESITDNAEFKLSHTKESRKGLDMASS